MSLDGIKQGGKMVNWKEDDMMDRYPDPIFVITKRSLAD